MSRFDNRQFFLKCDNCGRQKEHQERRDYVGPEMAWEALFAAARLDGWQVGDVDLCPECKEGEGESLVDKHRQPQTPTTGLGAVVGKWPGDETDEQIAEALDRLS